jgi:hypothetical protein
VKLPRRQSAGDAKVTNGLPTSGHAGDDALLAQITSRSDLEIPRHWVHHLYVPDEPQARLHAGFPPVVVTFVGGRDPFEEQPRVTYAGGAGATH